MDVLQTIMLSTGGNIVFLPLAAFVFAAAVERYAKTKSDLMWVISLFAAVAFVCNLGFGTCPLLSMIIAAIVAVMVSAAGMLFLYILAVLDNNPRS